jgi:hypothetical protein
MMHPDLVHVPLAVAATRELACSAMPDAPVVRRRPRRRWFRRQTA